MTKVQRYKVGYYTDEWGMLIVTPRLIPDDRGFAIRLEDYFKLETELAALKAELREICAAINDPACDLTLTTVECIKKLKAENEWKPIETNGATNELENHMCNCEWRDIETAPKDGTVIDLWHEEFGRFPGCSWGHPIHCCGEMGSLCDSDWHSLPEGWVDEYNEPQHLHDFTHWMPLPKPPAMAQGEQK